MNVRDTTAEAERIWLDTQRRLSPGQRIERAFELSEQLYLTALDALQRQHPDWGVSECRAEWHRQHFRAG